MNNKRIINYLKITIMLLSELNLKALNISAESVLPMSVNASIEGKEITFKITGFQSRFGSGKKTVISGSITRADNDTKKIIENADIEKVRRVCASLCELTSSGRTSERKSRAPKEQTEVKKISDTLKVARRLFLSNEWVTIDARKLRATFWLARQNDRLKKEKELKERELAPLLKKVAKLSDEARALFLASLQ